MSVTIKQKVKFNLAPKKLFAFYMDAKLHSELLGSKAVVSKESGSRFSAFGGDLKGTMLDVKNGKMITQTWRGSNWDKEVLDSILILIFHEIDGGTELELIHANVPDFESDGVKEGWKTYYWQPWKAYIKNMK